MPKPKWVEMRNDLRQGLRRVEELFDDDNLLDAFDEVETSDDAATQARNDPMGYLRSKGIRIPPGLEIKELKRESPLNIGIWWAKWSMRSD